MKLSGGTGLVIIGVTLGKANSFDVPCAINNKVVTIRNTLNNGHRPRSQAFSRPFVARSDPRGDSHQVWIDFFALRHRRSMPRYQSPPVAGR